MQDEIVNISNRLVSGDVAALRELYTMLGNRLLDLAFSILRSKETAEEAVSDAFLKLWQQREKLQDIENLKAYLYITTRNISLNYLHRRSDKRTLSIDDLNTPYYTMDAGPEELMISKELLKKINIAINALPPKCRLIFKLVREDKLKYREVAALLNISIKTVENQMGIALKKIHEAIDVYIPYYRSSAG